MPSLATPEPRKFRHGQHKFKLILPQVAFTNNGGMLIINNPQVLLDLNGGMIEVIHALKDGDKKANKKADNSRGQWSYDISPSLQSPSRIKSNGKLELSFRLDRNTAAPWELGSLTGTGLQDRGIHIPWSGAGKSIDVAAFLRTLILPLAVNEFQTLFYIVADFGQLVLN